MEQTIDKVVGEVEQVPLAGESILLMDCKHLDKRKVGLLGPECEIAGDENCTCSGYNGTNEEGRPNYLCFYDVCRKKINI